MSQIKSLCSFLGLIFLTLSFSSIHAQNEISWLQDFTGDMPVGNDTYRYKFSNADGNNCKLKIEEQVTNKKGSTEIHYWIYYLADLDPAAIKFDSRGKSIVISMETRLSQRFISYYEEGEFKEYTEKIQIVMNEVDKARSLIDVLKENVGSCKESQDEWSDREEAFKWLSENIGKVQDDDSQWEQSFNKGEKVYLARLNAESRDDKGEQESFEYVFDLNDINPLAINLKVSSKSLSIEVPTKEGENYIEVNSQEKGEEFTDEILIYADDIEIARQIVNALSYLVTSTKPERPQWGGYSEALDFVKANLGEVKINEDVYQNSIEFETFPSGLVDLAVIETDSDGDSEEVIFSFYLTDMIDKLTLDVSKRDITIQMQTKNKKNFIRKTSGEGVSGYDSDFEFHATSIDLARDIINAFEQAIRNSEEDIEVFTTVDNVNFWLADNFASLNRDGKTYEQKLEVFEENENQLVYEMKLTEDESEVTETKYIIYPEDIRLDEMEIKASGGKLIVALETDKGKFIKNFKNGENQNFIDDAVVYFSDPLTAKNFVEAVRFLKENSMVENRSEMSKEESISFLTDNIPNIELSDAKQDQTLEIENEGTCKLSFTRVETDDDGESDEYIYQFTASDIHPGNSKLEVKGELIEISLGTRGGEKLIKPYKNGEVKDFENEFSIYADDVVHAKKILAAFVALSEACR